MKPTSDQALFWQWFDINGNRLLAAACGDDLQAREAAMGELAAASAAAAPGLVLEMCRGREGKAHELIVSVDGKWELVDAAKEFVDAAPALDGWNVVAFRPREIMSSMVITLAGERVGADDVWFRVSEGSYGLDVILYVRGLTKANRDRRGLAASLLAEHAVGERDTLTLLNARAAEPLPETPASGGLRPLGELAAAFDGVKAKRFPPPGKLPFGQDSEWATVQGTRDGSPLVGLLHLGLRAVAGHPDYDRRLTVRIPYQSKGNGFPATREEYLAVCDVGERLTDVLQEGQQSLLALSIMTAGRRELIFHTADAQAALQRVESFRAEGVSHDLEPEVERDTFWNLYRNFCESPGSDEADEDSTSGVAPALKN
jgi:hypothetical protein